MGNDMQYQMQKYKHQPEVGIIGDCFPTCLACLLEIPRDDVPHFFEDWDGDPAPQWENVHTWLSGQGVRLLKIPYSGDGDYEAVISCVGNVNRDYRFLLTGTSNTGANHIVICKNGTIDHDPSIDQVGIVGPCDDGIYWIEFLVPLNRSSSIK